MRVSVLFLSVALFLASCTPQPGKTPESPEPTSPSSTAGEAQQILIEFFVLLNQGNYAEAVALYGGPYEGMQDNNPSVDPSDHVQLLTNACKINGNECLQPRSVTFQRQEGDVYVFQVEFNNPDGTLFVRGSCCGANETDMPPQSQFEYKVSRSAEGKFVVMDLPPYVP